MKGLRWDAASSLGRPKNCSFITRVSKAALISYDSALVVGALGVLIKSLLLVFEKLQSLVFSFMVTSASKQAHKQTKSRWEKGRTEKAIWWSGGEENERQLANKVNARAEFAAPTWMSSWLDLPPRQRRQKFFCYPIDNSARNWHVDGDWACVGFSLEEERVMQHRSSKYFPQFENQGINPVGESRQVHSTCTNTKSLHPML